MTYVATSCILSLSVFSVYTDADFGTSAEITVNPPEQRACIDFTNLVVDDTIALEGNEAFTIIVGTSMAMVTIIDDDGEQIRRSI